MSDLPNKEEVEKLAQQGLVKRPDVLEVANPSAVTIAPKDVELTAENADEMAQCQNAMVLWARSKVAELAHQWQELKTAYEYAVKQKWRNDTLKRHAGIAEKRLDFYKRMLTALEHGYQIVPSFPITAFAIRTEKKKPLRMLTSISYNSHTQQAECAPQGEGEYKNPFPVVMQNTIRRPTTTESELCSYWADAWKDFEFPLSMSKPKIMEATTRAMALKIFDEIGILPGFSQSEGTRAPRGDPLIVARLRDPRSYPLGPARWVSFIVAWHLDTKTL